MLPLAMGSAVAVISTVRLVLALHEPAGARCGHRRGP